ncbi:hypothetical protein FAUST_11759 [Fusarium austroamericanum]|uniref:Nucleoside phosphorylase domain-containing protein n=1 Tax=Fusarium austroamericanum TaxID=282268 RepID=A0AAN5YZQ8_FUSAU|nr:hypothetical protein FAUST_11759 [Fusarium austroamericanum]
MPSPSSPRASPVFHETTALLSIKTTSLFILSHKRIPCVDRGAQRESNSVSMNPALLPNCDDHLRLPKRQKTSHSNADSNAENNLPYGRYTIAWICALHFEMAAALAMMDEIHGQLPRRFNDHNTYTLGSIENHNIVIACLPEGQYGTVNAASVLTNVKRTFPLIRHGLMVGIGGAAPTKKDIRLGDIVVGTRIMQYDFGKTLSNGEIQRTAIPKSPEQLPQAIK